MSGEQKHLNHTPRSPKPTTHAGHPRPTGGKPPRPGDRKPFRSADGERRPFRAEGDRKPFRPADGERRPFRAEGDRKPFRPADGERRPFRAEGDRKPFRSADGERRPFRAEGDRKPFRPADGERRPFRAEGDRKPFRPADGERRPFRAEGDRKPFRPADGERRPMVRPTGFRPAVKKPEGEVEGLLSRRAALRVIRDVTENHAFASLSLDKHLSGSGLNAADRRQAARIAYDTIEHLLSIDHALSQVMAKPDTDTKLRNILRMAACQILYADRIPVSAATNTAVALCKELGMEGLAGVCNGILRNLVRQKDTLSWPNPETEPLKARSLQFSAPEWLVQRLTDDWGQETADQLLKHHQQAGYISIRPNMTRLDDEAFEKLLGKKVWQHEAGKLPHTYRISGMADIAKDSDFVSGNFSIQGESSMMACLALSPKRGAQVLDACAAPGGKACYLAEMMGGSGRVQAWELHEHRTALIAAQARRLGLENVRPMTRDAAKLRPELDSTMDAVLLDAPCSGLGVMADKPDVKYRVQPENIEELVALQAKILDALAPIVKPGGTLVYSTCSVLKDENVRQVEAFLARHPEYELSKLPASIPEEFRAHEEIGLQLMPHRDDVGGFYLCRMQRRRV